MFTLGYVLRMNKAVKRFNTGTETRLEKKKAYCLGHYMYNPQLTRISVTVYKVYTHYP